MNRATSVFASAVGTMLRIPLNTFSLKEDDSEEDQPKDMVNNDASHEQKMRRQRIKAGTTIAIVLMCLRYWSRRRQIGSNQLKPIKALIAILTATAAFPIDDKGRQSNSTSIYRNARDAPISVLLSAAKQGSVVRAAINSSSIVYQLKSDPTHSSSLSSSSPSSWKKSSLPQNNPTFASDIVSTLSDNGCLDISTFADPLLTRLAPILLTASPFVYLVFLYHMMKRLQKGDNNVNPTTTDDLYRDEKRITFADVAGIKNQVELEEIVSYLSDPRPFVGVGAMPPSGLLLHGPPGCGKTLLAKAVAGEADADYFAGCSGSDFVEIYVGQGSKRVRELFSTARREALRRWKQKHGSDRFGFRQWISRAKDLIGIDTRSMSNAMYSSLRQPTAVVFIDEIDALAKCRDGIGGLSFGSAGGNDEREQTLNALLCEMDGFKSPHNPSEQVRVIVIAATNRRSILDPAILRPGRFDRHVEIPPPDKKGRAAILRIHARNVRMNDAVDLDIFADDSMTKRFTGADLRNVINEAALLAVRSGCVSVDRSHLILASQRVQAMKFT